MQSVALEGRDAIVAGLDIVKRMPAKQEKLLVVFSDGEDLNSKLSKSEVAPEAPERAAATVIDKLLASGVFDS